MMVVEIELFGCRLAGQTRCGADFAIAEAELVEHRAVCSPLKRGIAERREPLA
jgi:hypothetical protein